MAKHVSFEGTEYESLSTYMNRELPDEELCSFGDLVWSCRGNADKFKRFKKATNEETGRSYLAPDYEGGFCAVGGQDVGALAAGKSSFATVNPIMLKRGEKPSKSKDAVRYLDWLYVDVDCEKFGYEPAEVVRYACDNLFESVIPTPTLAKFSGNGLWFFWRIERESRVASRDAWQRAQCYFAYVLEQFGSDGNVYSDESRIARVGGSVNEKNGAVVFDVPLGGSTLNLNRLVKEKIPSSFKESDFEPRRTLEELEKAAENEAKRARVKEERKEKREQKKQLSLTKRVQKREEQKARAEQKSMKKLERMAKLGICRIQYADAKDLYVTFSDYALWRNFNGVLKHLVEYADYEGSGREVHLFIMKTILRSAGYDAQQALSILLTVNASLEHPLSEQEVVYATSSADSKIEKNGVGYLYSAQTIVKKCGMTNEHAAACGLVGKDARAAQKAKRNASYYRARLQAKEKKTKKEQIYLELVKIQELVSAGKNAKQIMLAMQMSKSTYYDRMARIEAGELDSLAEIVEREGELLRVSGGENCSAWSPVRIAKKSEKNRDYGFVNNESEKLSPYIINITMNEDGKASAFSNRPVPVREFTNDVFEDENGNYCEREIVEEPPRQEKLYFTKEAIMDILSRIPKDLDPNDLTFAIKL